MRDITRVLTIGACTATLMAAAAPAVAGTAWSTHGTAAGELRWTGQRAAPTTLTLTATHDGHTTTFTGLRRGGWGVPAGAAIIAARDIDGDRRPELLVNLARPGDRGAARTLIVRWVPAEGRHRLTTHDWGRAPHRLRDLDGDGRPEFLSRDARWAGFAGRSADARLPVRIWRYEDGAMADVTRSFRRAVRADMTGHWAAIAAAGRRGASPRAAIAAYMATAHLMGRPAAAWARVRARHTAPGAPRYFAALERRLAALGYATTTTA